MIKTLDEIKKEYEEQIKIKEELNALSLPTGKNNMFTLTYISFFESKNLSLQQKGILIHLYIRGGHIRVVKHSINKLAKTIGINVSTMSRNIKKLEDLNYLKTFKRIIPGKDTTTSDLIYLYPINDVTGLPIKSSKVEIDFNIKFMVEQINTRSKNLFQVEEKNDSTEEVINDLDMNFEMEIALKEKLDRNINTAAHLSFMENPLLSLTDKVIYLYLKLRSGEYNTFFEEKKKIASNLKIGVGTLNDCLVKLCELNYIVKFKRFHSITGNKSSDVLYINYYDNFTGLPDINDTLLKYNIDLCKKKNFPDFTLVRENNLYSKKYMNELFTKQIKNLIELDNEITDVYYETFIADMKFKLTNDLITIFIPRHLNSFKEDLNNKLKSIINRYAQAILKTDNDFYITIESDNVKYNT